LKAKYSSVGVAEVVVTDSSPGFIVQDFQASFVCHITSCQSY